MLFESPKLDAQELRALDQIDELRGQLRFYLVTPRRWYGTLRRASLALAVQGSNSIEGYYATKEDVVAILEHEAPLGTPDETEQAIAGYRDAMTYGLQLSARNEPTDASLIKSLHFMIMKYDLTKNPGGWRPGAVYVTGGRGGIAYSGPGHELVEGLMTEFVDRFNVTEGPALVRAAMVHLNMAMIHPFSDGNGRMARILQSLVLATEGELAPEFGSIEEYLARNTPDYYEILRAVGGSSWDPGRDARPWLRFCLTAHYRQARTLVRRVRETEALWDACEQLATKHRLPARCVGALSDCARGWLVRRAVYVRTVASATGEEIRTATATRDLSAMVAAGLITPTGEARARQYGPSPLLQEKWNAIKSARLPQEDPPLFKDPSG